MHRYFIRMPWVVQKLFPFFTFRVHTAAPEVFLTFDDGPHPTITPWVLAQLRAYDAKATFFCIGNNVERYPEVYRQIVAEGHAVGNHTFHHLNGWQTPKREYWADIRKAAGHIHSNLFRPPYGRITLGQAWGVSRALQQKKTKVVLWDVLSADFDENFSAEQCLKNTMDGVRSGSIVVFHDSEKAFPRLQVILPQVLEALRRKGLQCSVLK